jgi:hypothetical protein
MRINKVCYRVMKKHIMLIENDPDGYTGFMDALEVTKLNCRVTYTINFEHALQMLEYVIPDCVFMHVDVNGSMAFERIKKIREQTSG